MNGRLQHFMTESRLSGLPNTGDTEGTILPVDHGLWLAVKSVDLVGGQMHPCVDADQCVDEIEQYGFHVTDAHVHITEQALS